VLVHTTLRRATLRAPLYLCVKALAQPPLISPNRDGVTVLAGWNPRQPSVPIRITFTCEGVARRCVLRRHQREDRPAATTAAPPMSSCVTDAATHDLILVAERLVLRS
jgi:hypothetical protein